MVQEANRLNGSSVDAKLILGIKVHLKCFILIVMLSKEIALMKATLTLLDNLEVFSLHSAPFTFLAPGT